MAEDQLPLELRNCPIADSVVEIRFLTEIFPQAVFGIAYEKLKNLFPKVEALPITQFPGPLLQSDQNLKFKPHYKILGDKFMAQIGPDVLSVSPTMPYPGWREYYPVIEETFGRIFDSGLIASIIRLGLRYTNFFEHQDIFSKLNLKISLNKDESIALKNTILRTEIAAGGFNNILQISNSASKVGSNNIQTLGSIIDVDTIKEYNRPFKDLGSFMHEVEQAHEVEKRMFWDLLNSDFRQELKPIY